MAENSIRETLLLKRMAARALADPAFAEAVFNDPLKASRDMPGPGELDVGQVEAIKRIDKAAALAALAQLHPLLPTVEDPNEAVSW